MAKINPGQFVREVRQEVSKVTWPTRKETAITTGMVFLMVVLAAVFFFLVGLEIKREFLEGELSSRSQIVLPAMAAVGGIWDPVAVAICVGAGIGAKFNLRLGGKTGPTSGDPLDLAVEVKNIVTDCLVEGLGGSMSRIGDAAWTYAIEHASDEAIALMKRLGVARLKQLLRACIS